MPGAPGSESCARVSICPSLGGNPGAQNPLVLGWVLGCSAEKMLPSPWASSHVAVMQSSGRLQGWARSGHALGTLWHAQATLQALCGNADPARCAGRLLCTAPTRLDGVPGEGDGLVLCRGWCRLERWVLSS